MAVDRVDRWVAQGQEFTSLSEAEAVEYRALATNALIAAGIARSEATALLDAIEAESRAGRGFAHLLLKLEVAASLVGGS